MNKPFAESCAQNQQVILAELKKLLTETGTVLEIGSGTGQHAVFFTQHLPHLSWLPSDLADQHEGMQMWLNEVQHNRINPPLEIDVDKGPWPVTNVDYVYTANTTHIISTSQAENMLKYASSCLKPGGLFVQYGPFNYNGAYTSESNARFDIWLKQRNPDSCIKHFETMQEVANAHGMTIFKDIEMPANNRILVWQKS